MGGGKHHRQTAQHQADEPAAVVGKDVVLQIHDTDGEEDHAPDEEIFHLPWNAHVNEHARHTRQEDLEGSRFELEGSSPISSIRPFP